MDPCIRPQPFRPCRAPAAWLLALVALNAGACTTDVSDVDLGSTSASLTGTVTLQRGTYGAVADTFLSAAEPRKNHGDQRKLRVSRRNEALLRFDVAAIPANAVVTSAALTVFVNGGDDEDDDDCDDGDHEGHPIAPLKLHRVTRAWAERTVTYASFGQQFDPAVAGVIALSNRTSYKTVDLTPLVQSWVNGTRPNYGLLIDTQGRAHTLIVSSEQPHVNQRPALRITYTTPDNHCSPNPCQHGGACVNAAEGFTCECPAGYGGNACQTNVDDCAPNPCQHGGTCADSVAGYACTCAAGYAGLDCETNVDDCAPNPCQHGGVCTDGIADHTCACAAGYGGVECQIDIDDCAGAPCQNGATCTDSIDGYACACVPGFAGGNCQINVDDCVGNPCHNGATCNDGVDGYTCACAPGFSGAQCDVDIDDCSVDACLNGGTCHDAVLGYTCACAPGFAGGHCEIDIDDCAVNPCANGGTCVDQVAAFSCVCATGYAGPTCDTRRASAVIGNGTFVAGDTQHVSGTGFSPGASVRVYFDNILGCTTTADATGAVDSTCFPSFWSTTDPALAEAFRNMPDGTHTVTFVDSTGVRAWIPVEYIGPRISVTSSVTPVELAVPLTITASHTNAGRGSGFSVGGSTISITAAFAADVSQTATMRDFRLALLPSGNKTMCMRTVSGSGSLEQIVGVFPTLEPTASIDRSSAAPGDTVRITGQGFFPGGTGQVQFGDRHARAVSVDALGRLDTMLAVPVGGGDGIWAGRYAGTRQVITVSIPVGPSGSKQVTSILDIAGASTGASLAAAPSAIPYSGGPVQLSGTGFQPDRLYGVTVDDLTVARGTTSAAGGLAITVAVPGDSRGGRARVINVVDEVGNRASAIIQHPRPAISVDRSTVVVGDMLTVAGTNLGRWSDGDDQQLPVWLDDLLLGTVSNAAPGTFIIPRDLRPGFEHTLVLGEAAAGPNWLTSVQLRIAAPRAAISHATSSSVQLDGSLFARGQSVTVWLDELALGRVAIAADQTFTHSFAIPASLGSGTHTFLIVSDDGIEKAVATLTRP